MKMFLNQYGQPIIFRKLNKSKKYLTQKDFEYLKNAPMLLSDAKTLDYNQVPRKWSGRIFTSSCILKEIIKELKYPPDIVFEHVVEPKTITLASGKTITITTIPVAPNNSEENVIFLLKDNDCDLTSLCTDHFSGCLDAFVTNTILREAIRNGIDHLYVDDTCFLPNIEKQMIHSSVEEIRRLAYLIKPKRIFGLIGAEMPKSIESLLENKIL